MRLIGFLFTFMFIIVGHNINAQNFVAGFSAGIAATQIDGDGHGGFDKAGPILGIWVGRSFQNNWFGRFELRYAQKGSFAKESKTATTYYRMRLHYFEIPIFAGYRFVNGFQALGGFSIGYLGKAQEMTEFGSFPDDDISSFNKFEFAGIAGVEYNYSEKWAFGAFFTYSFFPIRAHTGDITYRLNRGQYNQVLELVARYKL